MNILYISIAAMCATEAVCLQQKQRNGKLWLGYCSRRFFYPYISSFCIKVIIIISSGILSSIEKLRGTDNYPTWKFAMENFLAHEGLDKCIDADSTETDISVIIGQKHLYSRCKG